MGIVREIIQFDGTVVYESAGGTRGRQLMLETGFGYPPRVNTIDMIGDPFVNVYRRTTSKSRVFTISIKLKFNTDTELKEIIDDWEQLHASGTERVLKRVLGTGGTYWLDCVPMDPQWEVPVGQTITVHQSYEAANPWWYGEEVTVASAFAGVGPVNVPVVNSGNIATWISVLITNAVENPKVAVDGGYYVELDYTNGAGETIAINCRPAATIVHSVAGDIFGYHTSGSWFNNVKIPVGASNVVLTAVAGGVALCDVTSIPLYGAMR